MVYELLNARDQASDNLELEAGADLVEVELDDALKEMCKASKLNEILLPDALLIVRLQLLVQLLIHVIVVKVCILLRQSYIHELRLHDLQAVEEFEDSLGLE